MTQVGNCSQKILKQWKSVLVKTWDHEPLAEKVAAVIPFKIMVCGRHITICKYMSQGAGKMCSDLDNHIDIQEDVQGPTWLMKVVDH